MSRTRRTLLAAGIAALTVLSGLAGATAAGATGSGRPGCTGGTWSAPTMLAAGHYDGLTVSGVCMVTPGATVNVHGPVTIGTAGTLFAINSQTMTITGNVTVGRAAILALGCTAALGCDGQATPANPPSADTVTGDITAIGALALYLNGDTVNGNVRFEWGGWGPMCQDPNADDPKDPLGHDLVVKDNTVNGSVTVYGWSGCWMGLLRNHISGNVHVTDNYANPANVNNATATQPAVNQGLDSTEIDANRIGGRLTCHGNTPQAQLGDATENPANSNGLNTVGRRATGECASLITGTGAHQQS